MDEIWLKKDEHYFEVDEKSKVLEVHLLDDSSISWSFSFATYLGTAIILKFQFEPSKFLGSREAKKRQNRGSSSYGSSVNYCTVGLTYVLVVSIVAQPSILEIQRPFSLQNLGGANARINRNATGQLQATKGQIVDQ
jgi:hypothetical protein